MFGTLFSTVSGIVSSANDTISCRAIDRIISRTKHTNISIITMQFFETLMEKLL